MTTITTIGRITKDLELRQSERSGCVYTNFSLAVNEGFGEKQKTTFFECTAFGPDAERLIKANAKKGSLIQVTGKFGTTEFTRLNGEPGYSLRITVLAWNYIPGTGGQKDANVANDGNGAESDNEQAPEPSVQTPHQKGSDGSFIDTMNLDDEDLAF